MLGRSLALVAVLVSLVTPAWGQVGTPNTFTFPKGPIAQPRPTDNHPLNNPHPMQPWDPLSATHYNYGTVIQYITVPPEQVVVRLSVPLPDGVPPQTQEQMLEIPGYYVAETTTGYWYPERWTLWQVGVGVYQWVKFPVEFRRK